MSRVTKKKVNISCDRLDIQTISGTDFQMGVSYGSLFGTLIEGFYAQELAPNPTRLKYAKQCLPFLKKYAKSSFNFIRGMARGADLPLEAMVLLNLHEEIYHMRTSPSHCTGVVLPRKAAKSRKTYVAQNWDWQPQLSPWAGLLRMSCKGGPRILSYRYPGLWNCCGINSFGLALMWTGGGYFPPVEPVPGVPTYAIIGEIFRKKSVAEVIRYLNSVPRAGAFIFILADATGAGVIIEATPKSIKIEPTNTIAYRANLFESEEIKRCSKQSKLTRKLHSTKRVAAIRSYVSKHQSKLSLESVKQILGDKNVRVDITFRSKTLDQLIAICEERSLLVNRSCSNHGDVWVRHSV